MLESMFRDARSSLGMTRSLENLERICGFCYADPKVISDEETPLEHDCGCQLKCILGKALDRLTLPLLVVPSMYFAKTSYTIPPTLNH